MADAVSLSAPASTSNLGPGFDTLGLALSWHLSGFARRGGRGLELGVEYSGAREWEGPLKDLIRAAVRAWEARSGERAEVVLEVKGGVPLARGLGSSAAYRLLAAAAVNALAKRPLAPSAVLEVVCRLEGHTDNAAPCLFGGLTASGWEGERVRCARWRVSERLRFVALVPEQELETATARGLLPELVPRADAVFNLARSLWLVSALGSDRPEDLRGCFQDRLHQQERQKLVPYLPAVIAAAEAAGALGAFLSGSGSTILALAEPESADPTARAMERALSAHGGKGSTRVLSADNDGLRIAPL